MESVPSSENSLCKIPEGRLNTMSERTRGAHPKADTWGLGEWGSKFRFPGLTTDSMEASLGINTLMNTLDTLTFSLIYKNQFYFYTLSMRKLKRWLRKTISLIILGNKFNKSTKHHCKKLKPQMERHPTFMGNTPPNWSTSSMQSLHNRGWLLFGNWQADPKFHMETLGTQNNQNDPEKYKVGGPTLADFKMYCKAIVKAVSGI